MLATGTGNFTALGGQARTESPALGKRQAMGGSLRRRHPCAQAMNQIYVETARLMTRVVPLVFVDDTFALKGGTAINMFVRDMPRLSVDLDLVFQDHKLPRNEALRLINSAIRESVQRLKKQGFETR